MEYKLISKQNDYLTIIEQILTNRGIPLDQIYSYLNPSDNNILSPSLIQNIPNGVKMLIKHINNNDQIFIQIDSDCDGFTSAAFLLNYLNFLFPSFVQNNVIYRIHEGKQHGLLVNTIPNGVKMVIAPDSSSNDFEEHKILANKGIDVLVIDHHEAEKISENACVINNQLCDYPTKSLSGVGMVYKFCSYIDMLLQTSFAEQLLDLVSLGMVADMMDLKDIETKWLILKGIKNINNPFFKEMVKVQEYSLNRAGGVSPFGISFYIAPMVNATIRVGTNAEKMVLFESMLDYRAYELIPSTKRGCKGQAEPRVEQSCRTCKNVKNRQTKMRDASLENIKEVIEKNNLLSHKILTVFLENPVEPNLTGLIANELASEYGKPVLILNKRTSEEGIISWEGSGRNCNNSKLENLREFLNNTNLVMYAEGHGSAFGIGILDKNLFPFINFVDEALKDFEFSPSYRVDFIWNNNNFNKNDILKIAEYKSIWGQGVEEPFIAIEQIKICKDNTFLVGKEKNLTLKISLSNGVNLIKFGFSEEDFQNLFSDTPNECLILNIVGTCDINQWNGTLTPQITIEDFEIVKKEYYF